jgi:RND family efflux transporter MFP subunit
VLVLLCGLVGFTLVNNKKKIDEKAELSLNVDNVMPVVLTSPIQGNLSSTLEANGKFIPAKEMTIMSKTQGIAVKKLKKKGDVVKKGEAILKVEDHLFKEELKVAQLNYNNALKDVDRYKILLDAGATTKKQYEDITMAFQSAEAKLASVRDQLKNSLIVAPVSGILSQIYVEDGGLVLQGAKVAEIIDESSMSLLINVTEKEVLTLKTGQKATVEAEVLPGKKIQGEVIRVSSVGDKALNYEVEISVGKQFGNSVKTGMQGSAIFTSNGDSKNRILIDRKALVGSIKSPSVFIIKDNTAYKKSITIGEVTSEYVEVVEGINLNDKIVVSGQINLKDKTKVIIL